MQTAESILHNQFEQELPAVVPDLGHPAELEGESRTSDRWGHVCSARTGRACCDQCQHAREDSEDDSPNE